MRTIMNFKYFNVILTRSQVQELESAGYSVDDYVRGLDWSGENFQLCDQNGLPEYREFVRETDGILIFHDFGADYYFFAEWVF